MWEGTQKVKIKQGQLICTKKVNSYIFVRFFQFYPVFSYDFLNYGVFPEFLVVLEPCKLFVYVKKFTDHFRKDKFLDQAATTR